MITKGFPKNKHSKVGVVLINRAILETPLLRTETPIKNDDDNITFIEREKQMTEIFLQRFLISITNSWWININRSKATPSHN